MKYRKKPVVVDAVQLTWSTWSEICELLGDAIPTRAHGVYVDPDRGTVMPDGLGGEGDEIGLLITTLEGEMLGRQGDWIIRGVHGEFYPCKPDIFAATYEPADDLATRPDVEVTCTPRDGILAVSAETVERLDSLGGTLAGHRDWQVDIAIGRTPADTIHLTARPRNDQETAA